MSSMQSQIKSFVSILGLDGARFELGWSLGEGSLR